MMRLTSMWSALAVSLLAVNFLPATDAQGDSGCEETDACPLFLDVDADGYSNDPDVTVFTQGDWWNIDVFNLDDVEHTVTLDEYDITITIAPGENSSSGGFQFDVAGTFDLIDSPSGDSVTIEVIEGDSVDAKDDTDPGRETGDDDGAGGTENGSPSIGSAVLGIALLAVAGLVARRDP